MALMTDEDRKALPPGVYLRNKCDNCGNPIKGFLTYRGTNGKEFCSNACFEAGEGQTRGKIQAQRSTEMIDKKMKPQAEDALENKAAKPAKDKLKKKKVHAQAEPEAKPKKAKPAPEPEAEPAKPAKKAKPQAEPEPVKAKKPKAQAEPEPVKAKKPKGDKPAKETPYREGTGFAAAFKRLMSGKAMTVDQMFDGIEAGDPGRMIAHMIRRGDESGEFKIKRLDDGKLQMTKIYGK